ncbi:hypothetical protein ARMGADRAFT_1073817 [Armillaria gallica]|uniref:Uncharacterized protein n=1 Tax=Armillaria gallica TaxID=47427 RepID=A0A2H3DUI3_ARMGA|nr:hypothetical protein ARMGADRAFT_1073817 [Armillaria gallica]
MVASIIFLYIATTINFSLNLGFRHDVISVVDMIVTNYGYIPLEFITGLVAEGGPEIPGIGITVVVSTVIADSIMVCAILVANLNINLVLFKLDLAVLDGEMHEIWAIILLKPYWVLTGELYVSLLVIYTSCILATTLWCTILIVIRILTVTRGANGRLGDYHHIIEVLVESSALHSVTLIIYIALEVNNNGASDCFDTLAAITNGIAPTLLAGRVAAGHARPDDSWEGSIISSLRFEAHPKADAETCSQVDSIVDNDLEAHPGRRT